MPKILSSLLFILSLIMANTVFAEDYKQASISFLPTEEGFVISLKYVDVAEISDCTWDEVPICDDLYAQIQNGFVQVSSNDSEINLHIPLTRHQAGIFEHTPTFAILFANGNVLSAPIDFSRESLDSSLRWGWIRLFPKLLPGASSALKIKQVTFGHGARHLIGTTLSPRNVQRAIKKDMQNRLKRGELTEEPMRGNFPTVWVRSDRWWTNKWYKIEYKPFHKGNGNWNVGTYYPK